jgi:hypothetical protein
MILYLYIHYQTLFCLLKHFQELPPPQLEVLREFLCALFTNNSAMLWLDTVDILASTSVVKWIPLLNDTAVVETM